MNCFTLTNHNTSKPQYGKLYVISMTLIPILTLRLQTFLTRIVSWDRLFESHLMSQLNIVPNDSHEEDGQLAARTSGHYFSGRLCHNDSALLLWLQWQTYCPMVAVKSLCAQPVQKGRYLRIREGWKVYLDSQSLANYLRSPPKTGRWTADLYQKNLRSHSGGETRLRIEAVRDLTELNWTDRSPLRRVKHAAAKFFCIISPLGPVRTEGKHFLFEFYFSTVKI